MHVINQHLQKSGTKYLVGDKCTYADLAFMPWNWLVLDPPHILGEGFPEEFKKDYPLAYEWNQRINERASVKKVHDDRQKAMGMK